MSLLRRQWNCHRYHAMPSRSVFPTTYQLPFLHRCPYIQQPTCSSQHRNSPTPPDPNGGWKFGGRGGGATFVLFAFPKRDGEWIGGWSGRIVSGGGAVVVVGHASKQKEEEEEGSVAVGCRQRGGGEKHRSGNSSNPPSQPFRFGKASRRGRSIASRTA